MFRLLPGATPSIPEETEGESSDEEDDETCDFYECSDQVNTLLCIISRNSVFIDY